MYGYKLNAVVFKICLALAAAFLLYTILITVVAPRLHARKATVEAKSTTSAASADPSVSTPVTALTKDPVIVPAADPPVVAPTPAPTFTPKPAPVAADPPVSRPAASPPEAPATRYAVDAGLFRALTNARGVVGRLPEALQSQAQITPLNVHGETLYRVRIFVGSEREAKDLADELARDPMPPPAPAASAASPSSVAPPAPALASPLVSKPPASTSAAPAMHYAVDAGSFRILSNARGVVEHLPQPMQARAQITPVNVNGVIFYRVRIRMASKKEAETLAAELLRDANLQAHISALP